MELAEITAALDGNQDLLNGVLGHVLDTDKGKEVITNKADVIYKAKINDEVSAIHKKYDDDMQELLGERPGTLDGGAKQKTYDKIKELYGELSDLRKTKDSLTKDAEVQKLNDEIAQLKKDGGGAHWEKTYNTDKEKWLAERETLQTEVKTAKDDATNLRKTADIDKALIGLTFTEEYPESIRNTMIETARTKLLNQSKIDGDKIVYLDEKGNAITGKDFAPMGAGELLGTHLKDILKKENNTGGGGAPETVKGSIATTSIDGKDVKKLNLQEGSFKTRMEFGTMAEEALLKSGVTRNDNDWDKLKNEAYDRYNVSELPRQ